MEIPLRGRGINQHDQVLTQFTEVPEYQANPSKIELASYRAAPRLNTPHCSGSPSSIFVVPLTINLGKIMTLWLASPRINPKRV